MKKSIYKNLFQALPCSWKFINNAKCYSQSYRGGGGFPRPRWSIDWWCGLPDFGRNVIIDHLSRWGVCRGVGDAGRRRRCCGGVGRGGFHEGARRHQSESWHPSTRQPPRHRDTGTTTHLSALLPLPPRILFRFHCPECVTSRQAGSSVVARPPKSTEQWCRAPELVNHYLSLTQRPVKTARIIITVC